LKSSINKLSTLKQIVIIFFVGIPFVISAQKINKKSPKRAAIYSTILPGSGQVYTEKYWKVPVIYAGLITSAYYIRESQELYDLYKETFLNRSNGIYNDEFLGTYTDENLLTLTNHYRRNREVSTLLFLLTYTLNIVDASVNAHLFDYDVSEDLSLHIQPKYFPIENITGLLLSFNL
tara:strand:+ start:38265 stop:38795 length:531 start_codon:yes stop_codon:yes gene_type:complete